MFRKLWNGWKRVSHAIGNFQARVLLTVIYALIVLPFGLVVRLFADPMRIRRRPDAWLEHSEGLSEVASARRQW